MDGAFHDHRLIGIELLSPHRQPGRELRKLLVEVDQLDRHGRRHDQPRIAVVMLLDPAAVVLALQSVLAGRGEFDRDRRRPPLDASTLQLKPQLGLRLQLAAGELAMPHRPARMLILHFLAVGRDPMGTDELIDEAGSRERDGLLTLIADHQPNSQRAAGQHGLRIGLDGELHVSRPVRISRLVGFVRGSRERCQEQDRTQSLHARPVGS